MLNGRHLFSACRQLLSSSKTVVYRPRSEFASMNLETITLVNRISLLPNNLLVRNLRQMLEKINDEMELENEFINANQISLVTQGTINKGVVRCSSSNFFINSDVQINKRPSKAVACILKVFPQCFL